MMEQNWTDRNHYTKKKNGKLFKKPKVAKMKYYSRNATKRIFNDEECQNSKFRNSHPCRDCCNNLKCGGKTMKQDLSKFFSVRKSSKVKFSSSKCEPLYVFVCGPHCVGKTTLIQDLSIRNPSFHVIPEIARRYFEEKNIRADDVDPSKYPSRFEQFQRVLMKLQNKQEERDRNKLEAVLLYDRGPDPLAYISNYHWNGQNIKNDMLKRPHVKQSLQRYRKSLVFLVKPHEELIEDDKVRMRPSIDDLMRLYECMKMVMNEQNIPFTLIEELDKSQRIKHVESIIQSHLVQCRSEKSSEMEGCVHENTESC